jgi:hypothetical protein
MPSNESAELLLDGRGFGVLASGTLRLTAGGYSKRQAAQTGKRK